MAKKSASKPTAEATAAAAEAAAAKAAAATETAAAETAVAEAAAALDLDGRMLHIRSVAKEGRRRAGLAFTPEAIEVDPAELTDGQIDQLLADPQLIVEID